MGQKKPLIRLLSMDIDEEFNTLDELRTWYIDICKKERGGIFHLRSDTLGYNNAPGSIFIFKWNNEWIGEAIVLKDVEENTFTDNPEPFLITFEPSSMRLYSATIPVNIIREVLMDLGNKDIRGQGSRLLNLEGYLYIQQHIIEKGIQFKY